MSLAQGPLPYLDFCGTEIGNAARTVSYLQNGLADTMQGHWEVGDYCCSVLYRLGGAPQVFVSPAADPAPWYMASQPSSAKFLGVVLLDITGYDSTLTRVATPRIQGLGGGTFSGQRRNMRTWKFRAALISADDAGAEYGLRWLTNVLKTGLCDTCSTCDITVRLTCPPDNGSDDMAGEWKSYDVALTEGPTEVEKWAPGGGQDSLFGCRDLVIVEWTMTAGNPFLYKRPVDCLAPEIIGNFDPCDDICDFLFGLPGEAHCCTVTPPLMGTLAPIFTLESFSGCGEILLGAYTQCPVSTDDNPVFEMAISNVPPQSTVVVDCSQRRVTVTSYEAGTSNLVSTDGQALIDISERTLQWPEARDCDPVYCFCARTAHPCSQGGDTWVSIQTQLREG